MSENIKIVQDISLLYELSLAVGSSLDPMENCRHFLSTLVSRKELSFASVWLSIDQGGFELLYSTASNRQAVRSLPAEHFICQQLEENDYFTIGSGEKNFWQAVQESDVSNGTFAFYQLGRLGFLKLFSKQQTGAFSNLDMVRMRNVIVKFTISLEGNLAHRRLQEETDRRHLVQKALRQSYTRYSELFNQMYDPVILFDEEDNIQKMNKAAKKLLGCDLSGSTKFNLYDIVHPEDAKLWAAYRAELRAAGSFRGFEGRIRTQTGDVRYLQVNSNAVFEAAKYLGSRDTLRDVTEQKRIEKQVAEREETFRNVINYSLDAVVTMDGNGLVREWNKQAETMFGIERHEAVGQLMSELIIPHRYREAHCKGMEHFYQTGKGPVLNTRIETTALRKNGEEFPIELSIAALKNENGHFFSGFIRDITFRKQAQAELRNAQIRLTNLVTNLHAGVLLEDENREVVLVNQFFCKIFGIKSKPETLVGKNSSKLVNQLKPLFLEPEKFAERIVLLLEKKELATGESLHMADGRVLELDFIPLFSSEKYMGHLWKYHDISKKHKAQMAIRESEEKYRGIIENMQLGLLEVDMDYNIVRPNLAFCEMTGYSMEELKDKNALQLLLPKAYEKIISETEAKLAQSQAGVFEIQMHRKDGSLMWALISSAPITDSKGKRTGSIGIHFDLTARKQLEQDLAKAKGVAEKARLAERQFLANMSHEIRTPMNAVIGMVHLLYDTNPNELQLDYLNSLRFSADSLMGLIDNVLDLSKIESGELGLEKKSFNLEILLRSLQQTFQFKVQDKPISVNMDYDPDIKNLVIGDPTRLTQILSNLLGNASKFTSKGTVGVRVILLDDTPENYLVEFQVHDTGIGIAQDKLTDIFKNFRQADPMVNRKYGGTGLGLAIVKQLVEMQGGNIRVESEVGEGSSFIFTLPMGKAGTLALDDFDENIHAQVDIKELLKGMNILIAEDNTMNQKLITKILDTWGCQYELSEDGVQAVETSRNSKFDLILMDIHMPNMDGVEAASAIRMDGANPNFNTPIVALTAAALLEEKTRALDAGMNEFLTKPFSPRMLEACVLSLLNDQNSKKNNADKLEQIPNPYNLTINLKYLFDFGNGDRTFVFDIVDTFLLETPTALDALVIAIKAANWADVYKIVHKLKPNLMMLGMKAQQNKAIEIEKMIEQGKVDTPSLLEKINWFEASVRSAFPLLEQERSQN